MRGEGVQLAPMRGELAVAEDGPVRLKTKPRFGVSIHSQRNAADRFAERPQLCWAILAGYALPAISADCPAARAVRDQNQRLTSAH
jgi:hypothetical protein